MKTLLSGTFGSFLLGFSDIMGLSMKDFLEIKEASRRVSFFVAILVVFSWFYCVFLHFWA
ncbi:hypothetical protein [Epilithonimonas sp.]|uniref:hypothetical protein n=1 Tax=Epilithonimonas sp. TaxID=2894511 RepID=UPI0028A2A7C4|nr:hypothetical protein [Epilithonimonas sp.]